MSADVLREAAIKIRRDQAHVGVAAFCNCSHDVSAWFDRSICPEPCGQMHYICEECGGVQGRCPIRADELKAADRVTRTWLAVANWLDDEAETQEFFEALYRDRPTPDNAVMASPKGAAMDVARAYLGRTHE